MTSAIFDPASYTFNACAVPTLATAGAMFLLGLIVALRERASRESVHFCVLAATICIWLACFSLMYLSRGEGVALFWAKSAYLGVASIPAALYHFSVAVMRRRHPRLVWSGWLLSALFFLAIAGSGALVRDLYRYWWGFYPRFRWLGGPFLAFFFAMLLLSLREYWTGYRTASPGTHSLRTRSLMTGFSIAYLGSFDYVAAYGVRLYPFGYLPILAFIAIAAHTIRRYHLVDLTPAFAAEQILATVADPVIVCDHEGRIRFVNEAASTVFGYRGEELAGAPLELLAGPSAGLAGHFHAAASGTLRDEEMVFRTRDGSLVDVGVSLSPLLDQRRATVGAVLIARDVRARKRAETALRESEERFRALFERNLAGVFRTSVVGGVILDCNDAFAQILGFRSRSELLGKSMLDHYSDVRQRTALLAKLRAQGVLSGEEVALRRADGSPAWGLANCTLLAGESAEAGVLEGTIVDITERKTAESEIVYQAYHDALTGLPNRMLFHDRLSQAINLARRDGRTLAVLFLDLDQFKLVNDTLGHSAGDRLLRQIAGRLQRAVRESDTVSRVGGDEFTLLLPKVSQGADAARTAQKILETVAQPIDIDGQLLYLTTSIGISLFPSDGHDAEALLTSADIAMYRAKELGRNGFQLCTPAMNAKSVARLTLERDLRLALERGELTLLYQPQAGVASGCIVGVEALLRWNHPRRGLVGPEEFIGLAEETRLILPIGEWALRTACEQAKRWQLDGSPGLRLAVNLSALQFQQRALVGAVGSILADTGLAPGCLVLEITESAAMQDVERTVAALSALRDMGVGIAIDDFGTGHASLSYLRQFPIDALKIDRAFVSDMAEGPQGSAIITAIIGLAHGLGLKVLAEGVETESQLLLLTDRGCDEYQGFLISAPLAPGAMHAFFAHPPRAYRPA